MKRFAALALSFLMAASLFAGCRRNVGTETTAPTEATKPVTQPATQPATNNTTPSGSTGQSGTEGGTDASDGRLLPNMR
jgi:hypothetical protein